MNHPKDIKGYASLEDLANDINNLRYDSLSEFLGHLADKLKAQAEEDEKNGRDSLALNLYYASDNVRESKWRIDLAWLVCEKYMKK